MAKRCPHLKESVAATPRTFGCEECLQSGDPWVELRICDTCGHVGCCDSSRNRHATRHYQQTRHPVIRSFDPTDRWKYCYVDQRSERA